MRRMVKNNLELELPDQKILQTRLGNFLWKKCNSSAHSGGEGLEELRKIWYETYVKDRDMGRIKKRNDLIKNFGISKFIDENVAVGDNLIEDIFNSIQAAYIITDETVHKVFKNYFGKNKVITIDKLDGAGLNEKINEIKQSKRNLLLGVGGGRVMDYLKYIMMETGKFCVSVPTSLATHVYTSPKIHALPAIVELGEEKTLDGPVPDMSLVDSLYLRKLHQSNPRLIQAGLGDLMASITAVPDWKIAEEKGTAKVKKAILEFTSVLIDTLSGINVKEPLGNWIDNYCFAQVLLCRISGWAGSAPVSGSEHLFALAVEHNVGEGPLHGELVALGTIIMTYIQGGDYKGVGKLVRKLGLPTGLGKAGISIKQAIDALQRAKDEGEKKGRFTVLNTLEMNKEYCRQAIDFLLKEGVLVE
jgi:glycerol-1-phosphate dehydrogenase [NAD(P)+]